MAGKILHKSQSGSDILETADVWMEGKTKPDAQMSQRRKKRELNYCLTQPLKMITKPPRYSVIRSDRVTVAIVLAVKLNN